MLGIDSRQLKARNSWQEDHHMTLSESRSDFDDPLAQDYGYNNLNYDGRYGSFCHYPGRVNTTVETWEDSLVPKTPQYKESTCEMHKPDKIHSLKINFLGKEPKVILDIECYHQLVHWARCFDIEVSVFGRVKRDGWEFHVKELYFPTQECGAGHTRPNYMDLCDWLKGQDRLGKEGEDWLFWGHFHPGSSCSPSAQDEKQMELFEDSPFFIRGIFSRTGGNAEFRVDDNKAGISIEKVSWGVHYGDVDTKLVEAQVEGKVCSEERVKVVKSLHSPTVRQYLRDRK